MASENTDNYKFKHYICRPKKYFFKPAMKNEPTSSKVEVKGNLRTKLETKGFRYKICQDLKRARQKKGISQLHLAALIGSDQRYISLMESGKINVSLDKLILISKFLDAYITLQEKKNEQEL